MLHKLKFQVGFLNWFHFNDLNYFDDKMIASFLYLKSSQRMFCARVRWHGVLAGLLVSWCSCILSQTFFPLFVLVHVDACMALVFVLPSCQKNKSKFFLCHADGGGGCGAVYTGESCKPGFTCYCAASSMILFFCWSTVGKWLEMSQKLTKASYSHTAVDRVSLFPLLFHLEISWRLSQWKLSGAWLSHEF